MSACFCRFRRSVPWFASGFHTALIGGLCVLGVWASWPAGAGTVWMQNGDKLTGRIERLAAGRLTLATDYGGVMQLDWSQVRAVESSSVVVVENDAWRQAYLARLRGRGAEVRLASAMDQPSQSAAPAPAPEPGSVWAGVTWDGTLDLALNLKTASTRTEDYVAKLDTEWRKGDWRHSIRADYTRKTDNAVTTSHGYSGLLSTDRFLSERLFWQGRLSHQWDRVEEVRRRGALGTGPGYQFWDDETGGFSLAGLVGVAYYDYRDGASDRFYAASLRWDYNRFIGAGKRFELYASGELMRPLNDAGGLNIDAVAGVRYRLTDWVSWFLTYSRNQVRSGRQSVNEKRVSTGLGLTW